MADQHAPVAAEQGAILACLSGIRWRMYAVRLGERAALALGWASLMALLVTGSRILNERIGFLALAIAALPVIAGAWLYWAAPRLGGARPPFARGAGLTPELLRQGGIITVLIGLAAMVVLGFHLLRGVPPWGYPVVSVGLFLLAAAATVRPIPAGTAAIFVDQQAGLAERVSTALEFFEAAPASPLEAAFRAPVIASAVQACQLVRTAKVGYARIDSRIYALAATLAIAAAALTMINPLQARAGITRQPYRAVVAKGDALAEKLKELEATKQIKDPALDNKLAELRKVAEQMRQGNMSPFDANEKLSEMAQEFKDQKDKQDSTSEVEKALEASKTTEAFGKATEDMKNASVNASGNSPGSQVQKEDAQNRLKSAAGDLASSLGGMSDQQKKDLSDQLKNAADKAKDPQTKQDLEQASQAAQQGDSQKLQQSLADAGSRIGEQGAQQQLSSDAVRQAMDQIERAQGGGQSAGEQQANAGNGGQEGGQQQGGANNGGRQNQQAGQNGAHQDGQNGGDQQGQQANQGQGGRSGQQGGSEGTQAAGVDSQTGNGGSTNFHAPSGPGDHQQGRPIGGTGTFVKIYDEHPIDSRGKTEATPGHINPLGAPSGSIQTLAQADKDPSTIRTYESELPAARKRALDDLATQQIPPQYKDLVRAFYEK